MRDVERLLPCPFCGGENVQLLRFDGNEEYVVEDRDELSKKEFYPYVHCYGCDIDFCPDSTVTLKETVQAWNKRVYPEQPKVSEWILCSERLPETNVDVRVSAGLFVTDMIITVARMFECEGKKCWNIKTPVYAWQPLPKDYQLQTDVERRNL